MPTYRVILNCTVEQVAEFNIEAATPEEAAELAKQRHKKTGADWQDALVNYGTHEIELANELVHEFTFDEED